MSSSFAGAAALERPATPHTIDQDHPIRLRLSAKEPMIPVDNGMTRRPAKVSVAIIREANIKAE